MADLKVSVTVLKPGADGTRASRWVVVEGARVLKEAKVPNDPQGVSAEDQGRRWVKMAVDARGGTIELEDVPVEVHREP